MPRSCHNTIVLLNSYRMECAKVWNKCIEESKRRKDDVGKWPSRYELQRILNSKDYTIPTHVMQYVIFKYDTAIRSCIAARKTNPSSNTKFPHKNKMFFNATFDSQSFKVDYCTNTIRLASCTRDGCKLPRVEIPIKNMPQNIKQVEVGYENGFYLSITYVQDSLMHPMSQNVASVDMGEIHTITSVAEAGDSVCISGRKLRSIKYFRNKKQKELRSKMSACTKGSRQWKKYNKAFQDIRYKAQDQINDTLHKITSKYVNFAVEKDISVVIIGDPEGVQRNRKGKMSKLVNQKVSQWEFGKTVEILDYKLEAKGIKTISVSEAWTSQTCPECGNRYKPTGRNYVCKECGYTQHRDVVGAINILQFYARQKVNPKPTKYLRIS